MDHITNWPQAFVAAITAISIACIIIGFWIILSGSKFPWER